MEDTYNLRNSENAFQMYELYINRFMKEGDWMWSKFKIYLSLNTGVVALICLLFKEYLAELPFNAPVCLWIISSVLFFVGIYLSKAWLRVCEDSRRWLLLINKNIAELEPQLFRKDCGLYTSVLNEYNKTKDQMGSTKDVIDINVGLAKFFNGL